MSYHLNVNLENFYFIENIWRLILMDFTFPFAKKKQQMGRVFWKGAETILATFFVPHIMLCCFEYEFGLEYWNLERFIIK